MAKKKPKRSAADAAAKAARLADADYSEFLVRLERIAAKHDASTDVGSFSDVTSLSTPARNRRIAKGNRGNALTRRLREIVNVRPEIELPAVIEKLRVEKGSGLIVDVKDEAGSVIWKKSRDARAETTTSFRAIQARLSHIPKKSR